MTDRSNSDRDLSLPDFDSDTNVSVSVVEDPNNPDAVIVRTRKRKKGKRHSSKRRLSKKARITIVVVAVVVGLLAAVGIALAIAVNMGGVNLHQVFSGSEGMPEEAVLQDDGQIVEYKGHTYRYNENVVSVLLIGHDAGSSLALYPDTTCADVNALAAIDTSTNKVRIIVIPRNSWVPVDVYGEDGTYRITRDYQLTLSHAITGHPIEDCAENTVKSVSRLFYNLPITYYYDFSQEAVKEATRAVGGVQVEALESIPGEGYSVGDTVLLEGDSAYKYVQYRDTPVFESALDRQARQIQFVKAFMSKVRNLGLQGMLSLYGSVSGYATTNLGGPEIAYLISCFATGDNAELELSTLTGVTDVYVENDGVEYERYFLDSENVMEATLTAFYTQVD